MWGAISSILGKRKEEVEEDEDQIDESSIDENDYSDSNYNHKTTEELSTIIKPSNSEEIIETEDSMDELKENEITENEEIIKNVIDDNIMDVADVEKQFDYTTATVNQLLTRMVPDADISCPNVIVVGGQSSGKTKMIISMVFHHLIGNEYITDDMGEKLLKIFSTGEKMVTRRPTTIQFKKISENYSCNITIQLGRDKANYTDPKFDEIINKVRNESSTRDGKVYMGELKIEITAPGLPNISFTDLPGLITDNRQLSDSEGQSIRQLVQSYMIRKNTTLVVVEPASIEDFDTSQVSPLIRSICSSNERKDIFENSVLVLSKCDKIKEGLEPRIMQIMDLTSPQIKDYPYKHVVGVVNKSESNKNIDTDILNDVDHSLTFSEFKKWFKETKKYEDAVFTSYLNSNEKPCDRGTQCTTAAVFYQLDRISFDMVLKSIQNGIYSIDDQLNHIPFRMKSELAPPLSYYDSLPSNKLQAILSLNTNLKYEDNPKLGRYVLIENLKETFDSLLIESFKNIKLVDNPDLLWPKFISNDFNISKIYQKTLATIRNKINEFIDNHISPIILNVIMDPYKGCFAPCYSKFHRIDRFPKFCQQVINNMSMILTKSIEITKDKISQYFDNFWEFKVPTGITFKDVLKLIDEVLYITLRSLHNHITESFDNNTFIEYIYDDSLFEEKIEFIELRVLLQNKTKDLVKQREILSNCEKKSSNDRIRNILLSIYKRDSYYVNNSEDNHKESTVSALSSSSWDSYSFWECAENELLQKVIMDTTTNNNNNECSGSQSESSQYSASSTSSSSSPETAHTNMALDPSIPSMKSSRNKYSSAMINNIKTNNNNNNNTSSTNNNTSSTNNNTSSTNNNTSSTNNKLKEVHTQSSSASTSGYVYNLTSSIEHKQENIQNHSYNTTINNNNNNNCNNNDSSSKLTSPLKKIKTNHINNNNNNNNSTNESFTTHKLDTISNSFSFLDTISSSPAYIKSLFGNITLPNDDVVMEETKSFSVFNNIQQQQPYTNDNNIKNEVIKSSISNNNKDNDVIDLISDDSQ